MVIELDKYLQLKELRTSPEITSELWDIFYPVLQTLQGVENVIQLFGVFF